MLHSIRLAHSPRSTTAGVKTAALGTLPFLSQIAEEDITSGSTSVASFYVPNSIARRHHPNVQPSHGALPDQELFIRVHNHESAQPALVKVNEPLSYAHFNFDQSSKLLVKGNSMVSVSSGSVDVPVKQSEATASNHTGSERRKDQTVTSPNEYRSELSPTAVKSTTVKRRTKMRKQTQDISARAAQRRANIHHRELMEDPGSSVS